MAKSDEEKEDLESEKNSSEKAKISLPEMVIVLVGSIMSEVLEWLGDAANLLPAVGQAVWFLTYLPGLFVSAAIFFWSWIRGLYRGKGGGVILSLIGGGTILDFFTGGLFPETLTLLIAILLHNWLKGKNINRLAGILEKTK